MWPPLKSTFQHVAPTKNHIPKTSLAGHPGGTADDPSGARGRPGGDGRQCTPEDTGTVEPIDGGVASDRGGDGGRLWFDEDGTS